MYKKQWLLENISKKKLIYTYLLLLLTDLFCHGGSITMTSYVFPPKNRNTLAETTFYM